MVHIFQQMNNDLAYGLSTVDDNRQTTFKRNKLSEEDVMIENAFQ